MNSKKLSMFVIMITTFCICIMLYSSREKAKESYKYEENDAQGVTEEKNKGTVLNSKEKKTSENTEIKEVKKPYAKSKPDASSSKNVKNNEKVNYSSTVESVNKNEDQNNSNKKEIAVFKVSKGEIKDMLSLSDILRIESIAGKLSGTDFTRIKQYLQQGDDESVIKALKLLKERLRDKDYEKFKVVANKFINLEVVEGK